MKERKPIKYKWSTLTKTQKVNLLENNPQLHFKLQQEYLHSLTLIGQVKAVSRSFKAFCITIIRIIRGWR